MDRNIKLALPKGNLLETTSKLINEIGLGFHYYNSETRLYRLQSSTDNQLSAKIFQEKDIPVQVAVGNYDIGICGTDWINELTIKYPESQILKILDLNYDNNYLYLAQSRYRAEVNTDILKSLNNDWRIVSEYPNIAEYISQNLRLRRFRVFPVWGSAEAYPPENADLIIVKEHSENLLKAKDLLPIKTIFQTNAAIIVNTNSWQKKNLGRIISSFKNIVKSSDKYRVDSKIVKTTSFTSGNYYKNFPGHIYMALPDGHQMIPTSEYLNRVMLRIHGYNLNDLTRRPYTNYDWLKIKVIRPQDIPIQVANGNFDIAITGQDWFLEHTYQFPTSPVIKAFNLDFGNVRIVAVVHKDMPIENIEDLIQHALTEKTTILRVASEYINIADRYLRNKRIPFYKVIPTWGATEALLPEDADLLIENTQTGKTLEAHDLKIIDTLFVSSACVILNSHSINNKLKKNKISQLTDILKE